ncbi:MAG: hypothetical protein ACUVX8_05430 [Candidatus Zipacnadales bacterium]
MRVLWLASLLALAVSLSSGCKKSAIEAGTQSKPDPTEQAIEKVGSEQKAELEALRAEIAAWRSTAAAQQAEPDFKQDLAVAKRLTSQLSREASKQQAEEATRTLARLTHALAGLMATAPASRIQQHLERAEISLLSGNLEAASREILAAAGTAYDPTAPALVPNVLSKLEAASESLKTGDAAQTTAKIGEVLAETQTDSTVNDLAVAYQTALEAAACVERKSWAIVLAQMTEISTILNRVEQRASPQAKAESSTAAAPTEPSEESTTPPEAAREAAEESANSANETQAAAPPPTTPPVNPPKTETDAGTTR